jgi:DNA-binding Xre family transcriptional regulator
MKIVISCDDFGLISLQKTFSYQLDYLLPKKGYTASKLAKETGISTNTISMYRQNKRPITTQTFEKLINHLLCQPDAN